MRVEVECLSGGKADGLSWRQRSVHPGSWEKIDYFGPETEIGVFCGLDGSGSVLIRDPQGKIEIFKSENPDDEGKEITINPSVDSHIKIVGAQNLFIFSRDGKNARDAVVSLNHDDGDKKRMIPKDAPEKTPSKSPTLVS